MFWRIDWAPLPEEWSAFWAFMTVLATIALILIGFRQLSGLRRSNELLAESNNLVAESNANLVRPYVVVEFDLKRYWSRDPQNTQLRADLVIQVRNTGQTMATGVSVRSTPELQPTGRLSGLRDTDEILKRFERIRPYFDGRSEFGSIPPGRDITFNFDELVMAQVNPDTPKSYEFAVRYTDVNGRTYNEKYVAAFGDWKHSPVGGDPLERISRDIQQVSVRLNQIRERL